MQTRSEDKTGKKSIEKNDTVAAHGPEQEILLFQDQDSCPYFPGRERTIHYFAARSVPPALYEILISRGFRRSGIIFYQNNCPACNACLPIRVDVRRFMLSGSQRRVLKKNRGTKILRQAIDFSREDYLLYRRYCAERHAESPLPEQEDYSRFLVESPVPTEIVRLFINERLAGLGWVDSLPRSLSSVYISFDSEFAKSSPGTFIILKQVEMCAQLGKEWLHLGFWIKEHPRMSYKNRFRPCQVLLDGQWRDL